MIDDLAYDIADAIVDAFWPDAGECLRENLICNVQVLIYEMLEDYDAAVRCGMREWMLETNKN